jgi:Asp-tRNA(Asn)/Glu-tRNA(Gln) amidotransferase A subunit family amidase
VRDSAMLLDVSHGPDAGAPYYAERPDGLYMEARARSPGRARIAVQRRAYDDATVDAECLKAVDIAAELLRALGHEIIDVDFTFDHAKLRSLYFIVWPTLVRLALDQRSNATGRPWRLEDLETYVARMVDGVRDTSALQFAQALEDINAVAKEFRLQSDRFHAVLSPTTALVAPPIGVLDPSNPDQEELDAALRRAVAFTQIYNLTGQPAASLPLHWTPGGTPVGVQLATRYGDEALLLQLSAQLEEAQPWFNRIPPPLPVQARS